MRKTSVASLIVSTVSILFINYAAQGQSRLELVGQLENKRAELQKLEEQFLAPSDEDRAAFAELLKQPNTGVIRLLPRENFGEVPNKPSKLTTRGGGAYYSFARLTHEYGYGSDIQLSQGVLSVGFAGADYGMIIKLDGANLEDISTELPGIMFLAKYRAVTSEPQARIEQSRFGAGTIIDGISYRERVRADVDATYILRSIVFGDSDVLVAFKVVRQDTDGSLIIAWRMLEKYPTPKLARNN